MDIPPIELLCEDDVLDIATSKVDDKIAVLSVNGVIEIHTFADREDVKVGSFTCNEGAVRCIDFNPDATRIFCGCENGEVLLVTLEGNEVWKSPEKKKHEHEVVRVFCLDAKSYFSGDDEGVLKLWDLESQESITRTFKHHQDYISGFSYNADQNCVVVSSADGSLSVISMENRDFLYQTDNCQDEVLSCCVVKNGKYICAGTQEGSVNIHKWDEEVDIADRITGHPESIDGMLKIDEDTICTGSEDGVLRVVQVLPNRFLGVVGMHDDFPVEVMKWTFERKFLATSSHDNKVRLFDMSILNDDDDEEEEEGEEEEEEEGGDVEEKEEEEREEGKEGKEKEGESKSSKTTSLKREHPEKTKAKKDSNSDNNSDDSDSDSDSDSDAPAPIAKRQKGVSAKNLKYKKVTPKKAGGFFDDL